jgi:N-methylhydantoinase A
MSRYRVAVDIGGTFTDIVAMDNVKGTVESGKVLSTPQDLSIGILNGLQRQISDFADIEFFVHGTTAGLNAFLERKGASVALITTAGFRDVYEIGRANRPDMYNLFYRKPTPLVRRRHIVELQERTLYDGSILTPLTDEQLHEVVSQIGHGDYTSVAVCLLHAYANPEHEIRVAEALQKQYPGISVSLSHRVAREWREYERTSTTVLNAYIAPIVEHYLAQLESKTGEAGLKSGIHIMQSNGGIMTSATARQHPIQTLLSGPVGGTMGGVGLQEQLDSDHLLCVDMGGTSFDVSLVIGGRPDVTLETYLEEFPVLMPIVNIHTIGAGGGSIAWLEAGGLRVGPQSAGADPGPACYGQGGIEPTVTDANVALGRIDPGSFLGGEMTLDAEAARQALSSLTEALSLSREALAEGIIDIVNAKMANAIRAITVERGIDPRQFTLVAFGGAGPVHAVFLAKELSIPRVVVPYSPGTFSAWGMLHTNIRHDLVQSFYRPVREVTAAELGTVFGKMTMAGTSVLREEHVGDDSMRFRWTADMRYVGQEYFVNIPLPDLMDDAALAALPEQFHKAYLVRYGHSNPEEAIEFVNLRVSAIGELSRHALAAQHRSSSRRIEPDSTRTVIFGRESCKTAVFDRAALRPGDTFAGPAIVEEPSCTTVIPPEFKASIDGYGNIVIVTNADEGGDG